MSTKHVKENSPQEFRTLKKRDFAYVGVHIYLPIILFILFLSPRALSITGITYTGRILDSNNEPITATQVFFTATIYDHQSRCALYTEQRRLDLSAAAGTFSFDIGSNDATLVGGSAGFNTGITSLSEVFNNGKTFAGLNGCVSGPNNYTPDPTSPRVLGIIFKVGATGSPQSLPGLLINPVPTAFQAFEVNGYGTGALLKVASGVDQSANSNTALSQAQYDEFWRLVKNPLAAYLPATGEVTIVSGNNKVGKILGQALPAAVPTNGQVLVSNGTTWALQSLSSGSVTSVTATAPVVAGGTATAPVISMPAATTSASGHLTSTDWNTFNSKQSSALASGKVWVGNGSGAAEAQTVSGDATLAANGALTLKNTGTAGTYGSSILIPIVTTDAQGRITSVTTAAPSDVTKLPLAGGTMSGNIVMGGNKITGMTNVPNVAANPAVGDNGKSLRWNNGTTSWEWFTAAASGAGITSLNSQSGNSQSFGAIDLGTSVTAPAWSSASDIHTLKIPMASDTGVTAGLLSKTDHTTFSGKLTSPLTTKGDLLSRDGSAHVRLPVGTNNQVLTADSAEASGLKWAAIPAAGITDLTGDVTATGPGSAASSIGTGKVTSTHILDGTIVGTDMNFTGLNIATSNIVIKDSTGKFFDFACSTTGHIATWSVTGWSCAAPAAAPITNTASLANTKIWIGDSGGKAQEFALSGDATMSAGGVVSLASTITAAGPIGGVSTIPVITYDAKGRLTTVTTATVNDTLKLPLAGGTMSGDILMGGNKITGMTNVPNVAVNPAVGQNGQTLRWNNGTTSWEWFTAAASGAGITSLNSQSGNSQSFGAIDLGTSVTAPAWNSASDIHTLKIPMASDTGVTAGLLSKADHTTFSGKLTSPLTTKGDLLSRDGSAHVRLPVGTNGQVLSADSAETSGLKWVNAATGTVTSIATNNGITGGTINTTGTIGLANIASNTVLANTSGGAGTPVATTVPALLSTIGDTQGNILFRNGSAWTVLAPGTAGQVLQTGGAAANPSWVTGPAAGITALTGDVTASGPGSVAATIGAGKVTSSHILDGEIVGADMNFTGLNIATSNIVIKDSTGKFYNFGCATSGHIATWSVTGWSCAAPATATITNTASLANTKIWIGDAGGKAQEFALSGDATMSAGGVVTLKNTGTAGTYGSASLMPIVTTDAQGRVTGVTTAAPLDATKLPLAGGNMTGDIVMDNQKAVLFSETTGNGTNYAKVQAPASLAANYTLTLPVDDGTSGQVLSTDGNGVLSWAAALTNSLTSGKIIVGNASNLTEAMTMSGDATISNTGVLTIANSAVTDAKVATGIAATKIGGGAVDNTEYSYLDGVTSAIQTQFTGKVAKAGDTMTGSLTMDNQFGTVYREATGGGTNSATIRAPAALAADYTLTLPTTDGAANEFLQTDGSGNLTWATPTATLPSLADTKIWIGNGSSVAMPVSMSGDATIANTGAITLKNTGTAGTYGSASLVPIVTTDAQGRVTGVTTAAPLDATKLPLAGGTMSGDIDMNGNSLLNIYLASGAILLGNASNRMASMVMGGDVTIANNGVTTIGVDKVTTGKILDATILGTDMNFTGAVNVNSGIVLKDSTGKFNNFVCSTTGHVPSWSVAGWTCAAPSATAAGNTTEVQYNSSGALAGSSNFAWDNATPALKVGGRIVAGTVGAITYTGTTGVVVPSTSQFVIDHATTPFALKYDGASVDHKTCANAACSSTNYLYGYDVTNSTLKAQGKLYVGNGAYSGTANYSITMAGSAAGTVGVNRNLTADSAGNNLTIIAGGATSGATNKSGGNLYLNAGVSTGTGTSNIYLGTSAAGSSGTADNSTTSQMTILGSGYVGIGIAVPTAKLHLSTADDDTTMLVSNTSSSGARYPGIIIENFMGTTPGSNAITMRASRGSSGSKTAIASGDNLGQLTFRGWDGSTFYRGASVDFTAAANFTASVAPTDIIFSTTDTSGVYAGRLKVAADGNVGIGVASPQAALDVVSAGTSSAIIAPRATTGNRPTTLVNGMIRYNTTTALFEFYQNGGWVNYTTVSDGRLKTNIIPVNQGLDIVNRLNPVFFDWDQNNPRAQSFGTQHQVGFIAQDVEKVLPEVVNKGEDTYRSVEYGKIVAVVVAAVKELYTKVMGIENDVEELKTKDATREREIASVKAGAAKLEIENENLKRENAVIKGYLCSKDKKAAFCK